MAYTLPEIQQVLTNLKATYLSLTTKLATALTARDRDLTFLAMADVRKEIEEWEAREAAAQTTDAGGTPGVAYVQFQDPS